MNACERKRDTGSIGNIPLGWVPTLSFCTWDVLCTDRVITVLDLVNQSTKII